MVVWSCARVCQKEGIIVKLSVLISVAALGVSIAGCGSSGSSSGGTLPPSTPPPSPMVVAANRNVTQGLLEFSISANGNVAPSTAITGSNTGLISASGGPIAVAVDSSGRLYTADDSSSTTTIEIFAAGAAGDVAPVATLTNVPAIGGLALDSAGNLYVANWTQNSIRVYAPGATGNAAPIRVISGSNTLLNGPACVYVDGSGNIYVCNSILSNQVLIFPANANGNVAPASVLSGSNTQFNGPDGITVNAAGDMVIVNGGGPNGTITIYPPGANGNVAPLNSIGGASTGMGNPSGIALDAQGNMWIADPGANAIFEFAANASGNVAPIKTIQGSNTELNGVFGPVLLP